MYLPLYNVADIPFHIQGDELRALGLRYNLKVVKLQEWSIKPAMEFQITTLLYFIDSLAYMCTKVA